jgi:hypothetical protein
VSAIANEKIKAEKEANVSKKKQGAWFHLFFILSISKILRHFETLCFFWVMDFETLVKSNSLVQKRENFQYSCCTCTFCEDFITLFEETHMQPPDTEFSPVVLKILQFRMLMNIISCFLFIPCSWEEKTASCW